MGTNFYMTMQLPCHCCGRPYPRIHIGKRAGGWKFNLQALKDEEGNPIPTSWQMIKREILNSYEIQDDYGDIYSKEEMIKIVQRCQTGLDHADQYPATAYHDSEALTGKSWKDL